MDVILEHANTGLQSAWPGCPLAYGNPARIFALLWVILMVGSGLTYFLFAGASYFIIFKVLPDRLLQEDDRKVKPGQIAREIRVSLTSMPLMAVFTALVFLAEWAGWSRVYSNIDDYGWAYFFCSIPLFLMFTDMGVYFIHYTLHTKHLYKWFHSQHHSFLAPTPWAAIAFDPVDGFAQSSPYHLFVFLFPFHSWLYLCMFIFVQIWTISIHDRVSWAPLDGFLNGSAHHFGHHMYFKNNYGQYFTIWDRVMGTHKPWDFADQAGLTVRKAAGIGSGRNLKKVPGELEPMIEKTKAA